MPNFQNKALGTASYDQMNLLREVVTLRLPKSAGRNSCAGPARCPPRPVYLSPASAEGQL